MQNFVTLVAFFLLEKYGTRREKREKNNAKYYGHLPAAKGSARTPLGPIKNLLPATPKDSVRTTLGPESKNVSCSIHGQLQ